MKNEDSVFLNLFMRDNEKCNISHAPSTALSGIQFTILNVSESLIPKDQKNMTTLTASKQYLTPAVAILEFMERKIPLPQSNQNSLIWHLFIPYIVTEYQYKLMETFIKAFFVENKFRCTCKY